MKKRWQLQHTGYPTAGRPIEESEWKLLSYHTSAKAALRRYAREIAHLDYGSWDDHYRFVRTDGKVMSAYEVQLIAEGN